MSTRTLQLESASMKATFNETACDLKSRVLTSNFPDNHSFWRSLTYTDASTTSHTPHMHAQNGRKMTVIVFYRVTMDKVVGAPRITHLLTVTFGSRGCKSDVKSRCQVSPVGTPEKDPRRVPVKLYCNGSAYDSKCVLPQALSSFVNVSVTQRILSSQEIFILFKSQLPIWYCQNVYNFVPKSFFFSFYVLGNDLISIHNIPCPYLSVSCY